MSALEKDPFYLRYVELFVSYAQISHIRFFADTSTCWRSERVRYSLTCHLCIAADTALAIQANTDMSSSSLNTRMAVYDTRTTRTIGMTV